ncbi:hypothetical protein RFI_04612 [Reticulomyxa filosa]|uniref:Uncharacterized protein n=1 Tax=Reticulomyxa filosa TaxID=46433 RepID=X6P2Z9_RETFI|nr:hypothetical protein RFI_04612 [Reticulomyxa filosa]|eukprot:ETO32508.1 hypothetical protein RFI_04612 [Reticulomyxa filosa]
MKKELLWVGKDEEGDYSLYSIENPLFGPDKLSFINKSGHYAHLERLSTFFRAVNSYYRFVHQAQFQKDVPASVTIVNNSLMQETINKSIKIVAELLYNNMCSIYELEQKNSTNKTIHKEKAISLFMPFIVEGIFMLRYKHILICVCSGCRYAKTYTQIGFLIGLLELSDLNMDDLINVSDDIKSLDNRMSGIEYLDMEYLKTFLQICRKFVPEIKLVEEKEEAEETESNSNSENDSADEEQDFEEESSKSASPSMSEDEEALLMMKLQCMFPEAEN